MKLIIAGYNIDKSLIDSLNTETATPEVISAAYARISRSSKDIDFLRDEAISEISKARASNTNIIFDMGHSSVAEHAVFNLDLIGVSRLLTDTIQRSRLASFTEKSQRYVTFSKDYIVPEELNKYPKYKKQYKQLMDQLFSEYETSFNALNEYYKTAKPKLKPRDREALAKEDARYILPLSTKTQMGITINARSLENLLRRLAKSPLAEAKELHHELYSQVSAIAPSLIRYTEDDGYMGKIDLEKVGYTGFLQQELPWMEELDMENKLKVLTSPSNPDDSVLTAIIYQQGELNWSDTNETVSRLPRLVKQQLWNQVYHNLKAWHKVPRAFETIDFSFELTFSESCWAQFKRHRFCTMLRKGGNSAICKFPDSIATIGRTQMWESLASSVSNFAFNLPSQLRVIAPYCRLNSSLLFVYAKMNLREIYHFIRLRSDEHAQWEIKEISHLMANRIIKIAPKSAEYLCGKSEFCRH
ncbi:MAG: thymidylate synthase (FAD) [Candidatus Cloacimonetes bacterium HGW-Cloacimonetes-3]|jgi:flavin-dependent thymidylate synthase|nr:MAG: thymidylate synthase (FAD) [Candidatus Cloacimonetes bacterium HGW-Cloacimonetes-3]